MQTGDVITRYLDAAADGRVRDPDGRPYGREQLRALRGALSHVGSDELGMREIADVHDSEIRALMSRLRALGMPSARVDAITPALRSLYDYAIREGLAAVNPVAEVSPVAEVTPVAAAAPRAEALPSVPTPTAAMLAVTEHALAWTVRMIVVASLLVVVALVIVLS
jgi:site-specific recombinase XerC